jgi:hypothetical protein
MGKRKKGNILRCQVGNGISKEYCISAVNHEENPVYVENDLISGYILVRVKDFHGIGVANVPVQSNSTYFDSKKRCFSVQTSLRFKQGNFSFKTFPKHEKLIIFK